MRERGVRTHGFARKPWLIGALAISALYSTTYYALAHTNDHLGGEHYETHRHIMLLKPDYLPYAPMLNDALRVFYYPMHLIDLQLRTNRWRA
jgi:hypothetical protein